MSTKAISWAIEFDAENATEKAVLLILANYAGGDGESFPGQQNIARQAACSDRTVRRILESLEQRGIIAREERRRRDGSRTSDGIVLLAFQQAAKLSGSSQPAGHPDRANRTSCPTSPDTVSGLTSFEPSEEPSAAAARGKSDLDILTDKLLDAAGDKIQPHGAIVLAPILGLLDAGCDLDTDILPTIRARAAKMARPAGSWSYFVAAIRDAYEARLAAGRGLKRPKPSNIVPGQWEQHLPPDEQREKWRKTLSVAHLTETWKTWLWGPPPGQEGCRVPADLLEARDLDHHWFEEKHSEAA